MVDTIQNPNFDIPEGYEKFCAVEDLVFCGVLNTTSPDLKCTLEFFHRLQDLSQCGKGRVWTVQYNTKDIQDSRRYVFASKRIFG